MLQSKRAGHLVAVAALSFLGCGDDAPSLPTDRVAAESMAGEELALTVEDLARRWVALPVPRAVDAPFVTRGPNGWLAAALEEVGGRSLTDIHNYVYRSEDGIRWHKMPFGKASLWLRIRGLAYGSGRYVMVGSGGASGNVIWTSTDGAQWSTARLELGDTAQLWNVSRIGDRFVTFALRTVLSSADGLQWHQAPVENWPSAVAHGNGRFVLVGSGPMALSDDGASWSASTLPCTLPGACDSDPSGRIYQGFHRYVAFADGRFWTDQLSSADGQEWVAHDDFPADDQVGGYLFGSTATNTQERPGRLRAWRPGQPPVQIDVEYPTSVPLSRGPAAAPDLIDLALPGGETCATHRCLMVSGRLYLLR